MAKMPYDFEDEIIEVALNSWIQNFKICNDAVESLMRILSKELPYLEMKHQIEPIDYQRIEYDEDEDDLLSLYSAEEVSQPDFEDKDFLECDTSKITYIKSEEFPTKRIKLEDFIITELNNEENVIIEEYNEEINKSNFDFQLPDDEQIWINNEPEKQLIIVNDASAKEDFEIALPCQTIDNFDELNDLCRRYEETKSLVQQICLDQMDKNVETFVQKCLSVVISSVVASQIDCDELDIKKIEVIQIIKDCVNKTFPLVNQKDLREIVVFWLKNYQNPTYPLLWPTVINTKKVSEIEDIVERLSIIRYNDIRVVQKDLKIPSINIYDFYELEIECHNSESHIRNLCKLFLNIKEESLSSFVRSCLNSILTKKCATKFGWLSVKTRANKIGLSNFLLIQILLACAQKRFCRNKDLQIKYFIKRYFQSADKYYWSYIKRLNTTNIDVMNTNQIYNDNINNISDIYTEVEDESLYLINLPLESIDDNDRLEKVLKTSKISRDAFREIVQSHYTNDLSKYLAKVLESIITNELAITYYFNKVYRSEEKLNINQMYFIKIIKQCTLLNFSHSTVEEIDFIIRRWFNTTKDRFYSSIKGSSSYISEESDIENTKNEEFSTTVIGQPVFGKRKQVEYFKDPNNEFSFPLNCLEDVQMFDEKLSADKNLEETLKIFFLTKVEKYPAQYANTCMHSLITSNIIQQMNWSGKNHKITATNVKFINMIKECAEKIFENRFSSRDIHILMTKCFSRAHIKTY